jgi:hypothetical protein
LLSLDIAFLRLHSEDKRYPENKGQAGFTDTHEDY